MHSAYSKIFWGLLIINFDFRIGNFDFLPDFIGYFLIALGCLKLNEESSGFTIAQLLCWPLLVLSIITLFTGGGSPKFLTCSITIIDALMIWSLLGGVRNFCTDRNFPSLANHASWYRIFYLILAGVVLMIDTVVVITWMPLIFMIIGLSLSLMLMILCLMKRVQADILDENS